ncbi:MAG: hypothetical protein OES13_02460 [Acidimicrobiia bacterium]|nr:hypothetical protein [Acidimicrobiia bacterium]
MAMSQEHKDALARGRKEARAIASYLDSLGPRKRGRPVTEASIQKRLEATRQSIRSEHNSLRRVELVQRRLDLERQLSALGDKDDRDALEKQFIRYARSYSERKSISRAAWREAGVPASVLQAAGIKR